MRKGGICTVNDISKKRAAPTFLSGILVLTAANLLTKIIGLVFKIPLTNMLGDEGMGYFNTAYQIYTWLYMISTAGLPVALSLMISEYNAKNQRVYFVNTKEIMDNKFGTTTPMMYDDPYYKTALYIRYFGQFSFRISDPIL